MYCLQYTKSDELLTPPVIKLAAEDVKKFLPDGVKNFLPTHVKNSLPRHVKNSLPCGCKITLPRTPAYKTGTPFLPFCKSVPAPVGIASISFLRQRHLHNRLTSGSCRDTAKHVVSQYMRYILGISVTAPSVLLCHHRGKLHCIGIGVSSIILFRP